MSHARSANDFIRSAVAGGLRMSPSRNVALAAWLFVALGACFVAYISRVNEITHDVFHEMALVREAIATGTFPTRDVFAYTPTVSPSVHHEWGTGAVLYFATVGSGLGVWGITLLKSSLVAALWFVLYRIARLRGAHPVAFAVLSLIVFPFFWVGFGTIRAQLFTLVFIAIQLWMEELDWRGRKVWVILWWIMLVVWLNMHAGFVVGLCLMAVHGCERLVASWLHHRSIRLVAKDTWHLVAAALAVGGALPLNPYGWEYVPYLVHAIAMKRPQIAEWSPLWNTYNPTTTLGAFSISLLLLYHAFRHRRWWRLEGFSAVALCDFMAAKHIRHGSIYGVVWLAYVPAWITHTPLGKQLIGLLSRHPSSIASIARVVAVGCCTFAMVHQFWKPTLLGHRVNSATCFPIGAVDYLKRHDFRGNLMTPFHAGAYVSWELHPRVKVSLDGRYEVAYQPGVFEQHYNFYRALDGWQHALSTYSSDAILINRDSPVLAELRPYIFSPLSSASESLVSNASPSCQSQPFCHTPSRCKCHQPWRIVYEDNSYLLIAHANRSLPMENHCGQILQDRASVALSSAYAANP